MVRELVTLGAKVDERTGHGDSPLSMACTRKGTTDIIHFLLEKGADPNEKGEGVWAKGIMEAAAVIALWDVVEVLIENGAKGAESKIFVSACHDGQFAFAMKMLKKFVCDIALFVRTFLAFIDSHFLRFSRFSSLLTIIRAISL